jgi:glycosyltransferase involved in cell wall biosynthesis
VSFPEQKALQETEVRPLFSVVIPAYNAEGFIRSALDSVARQTFTNYEIVVVDDGSQDGTSKQVEAWASENPATDLRLVRQGNKGKGGGAGGARNAGVRDARGEYIAFLDSDDMYLEHKLQTVAELLAQAPLVDLVCHDEWLEENGHRRGRLTYGPHTTYQSLLFKGNCLSQSSTIVRRSQVIRVGGFTEDLTFNGVEDYDLWLRLARSGCRFEYVHEVLGVCRVNAQGVTSKIEEHCQHYLNVLEANFAEWNGQTAFDHYRMRRCRSRTFHAAGHKFLRRGEHREAQQFLRRALKQDPFSWKAWTLMVLSMARVRI